MRKFNIIKKNRKYFAATTGGCKCKILIDEKSENLELGEIELEVEDVSVRTKYGTDLIFKLEATKEESEEAGIVTLQHAFYNKKLVEKCKKLNGKWDRESRIWVFSGLIEDKVEELDFYYNSDFKNVEITFLKEKAGDKYNPDQVFVAGYVIAKAKFRDNGEAVGNGVSLVDGTMESGGSRANPKIFIKENAKFRMNVSQSVLSEIEKLYSDIVSIKEI